MATMVSLTEAKAKLNELVRIAENENVALMRHSEIVGLIVSLAHYEGLLEEIEDLRDRLALHEGEPAGMNIPLEKVRAELGLV